MQLEEALLRVQSAYPKIYLACHTRHQNARTTGQALSQRDVTILAHLSESQSLPQGLLTRHLGIAKSTLSEALTWLEQQGMVSRTADPADPRGALVKRTDAGSVAMSQGSVLEAGLLRAVLRALPEEQLAQAVEGLELSAKAAVETPKGER